MKSDDSSKAASKIACAIVCIGLTYFGFENNSTWAFLGAVFAFLGALD